MYFARRKGTEAAVCAPVFERPFFAVGLWDIYYIHEKNHCVYVHTNKNVFTVGYTIDFLAEQLISAGFVRTHQDYLVNCRYIHRIGETEVLLKNGDVVLLSDECKPALALAYYVLACQRTHKVLQFHKSNLHH